ncbi:MAG: hypothetical protein HYX94_00115 [Chloroflexi bacterium]|nr:hypothetical protein [Chloroflexota bacterium]
MAILSILAAIVAGNTTGMSAGARGSSKSTDVSEVQKAVDNFKGQHPRNYYPTSPQTSTLTVNTQINFSALFTTPEGTTKTFVPDFLQRAAKHAADAPSSWQITTDGTVTSTLVSNVTFFLHVTFSLRDKLAFSAYN